MFWKLNGELKVADQVSSMVIFILLIQMLMETFTQ